MASAATESRSPSGSGVTKKKLSAACVHCHRRKVRCDARAVGFPCSNCRSAGKTDCRIHEKKKRPIVRSALNPVPIRCAPSLLADPPVSSPSQQHQHQQHPRHNHQQQQQTPAADVISQPLPPRSSYPSQQQPNHGVEYKPTPKDRLQSEESSHRNQTPQPTSQSVTGREDRREMENRLVTLIDEQDSDRREIQRGVRAIYVGHDVSNMSFLLRQQRGDEASYHFAGNEIPRRRIEIGHDQLMQDALTLPEQSLADELVDAYFTHVNPLYPIVDEEQFMAQYRNRDPADPPPILILQAILLVGAHVSRQKQEREELKNVFFRRCKWLFDSRIERNRDILVQVALLLTWHSDAIDDDVSANAHYWVGVAARIATGLGMHRNPVSNKFAASDRRMWRRVWWILVQYDVLISLSYGRPQAINLEDCDVQSLTPTDFIGCGSRVQADFVMHFAELCSMISYILRERFGLRVDAERRKAILPKADEALANWSLGLPDSLRLRSSDIDSSSAMLHLTYNNFLILLHRPHPKASAYSEDYGPHDAEICSAAAGVITSIIEELRQQNGIRYLWCSGVFTVFTAMIQVRVELRFSNPVLAINALRRFDSTLHSLRELADYWSSAETILRLFENSKRLQQDLRVVHNEVTEKFEEPRKQTEPRQQTTPTTTTNSVSRAEIPPPPPSMNSQSIISAAGHHQPLNSMPATASAANLARPGSNDVWPSEPPPASRLDSDTFARANDISSVQQVVAGMDTPREYLDWRQLFPFTDPANPGPMSIEAFPDMEDEWRQLYWEPQMTDLFQEGIWLQ